MKISPIEVTLIDSMGSDLSIVNAARVSFSKVSEFEWFDKDGRGPCSGPSPCGKYFNIRKLSDKDTKLINYLAKHKHHSPFNHTFITVRVKAPIFVARQLVKHKFMPWNEVSRRYVDDEPEFYFPDVWRGKPEDAKQGSSGVVENCPGWNFDFKKQTKDALSFYQAMIKYKIAPEQARLVLPQNTMTEWYWSGTLGAFGDMLKLRLDSHAQQESREVAEKIRDVVLPLFPVGLKALLEN